MSTKRTESDKHAAGGPGKPAKQGHLDGGASHNRTGQKQTAQPRGPGKGGTRGASATAQRRTRAPG